MALLKPSRSVPEVEVVAVAARDAGRAQGFASKHGIPRALSSYEALLGDPEIDAIYNPLPNGLHCEWTIKALEAGKHVLCEKPIASNAEEAQRMAEAAAKHDRRLFEAFHWRYHPLADRMKEIVNSGVLGAIRHLEVTMCLPVPLRGDIRYRYDLGGGATMDMGCYTISILRHLAGAEPEVVRAEALLSSPQVDRAMKADFRFEDGRTAHIHCSLFSATGIRIGAKVRGEEGELSVFNPVLPHLYHRVTVRTAAGKAREKVAGDVTYACQLRAFAGHVRGGTPVPTDAAHGVANMKVIDAVYDAAGLPRRGL
jgi:predicted dehydrogenase